MLELSSNQLLLASIAVFLAAALQVLTGFGFAVISIPLLLSVFPGYEAVVLSMSLSMFTLLLQARKNWRSARWDLIKRLIFIGYPSLFLGLALSGRLNTANLKGLVGVSVLSYVFVQWILVERERIAVRETSLMTPELSSAVYRRETASNNITKGFYLAGLLSGVLTGAAGMPGPPVVAVLAKPLPKEIFRATVINYFVLMYFASLILSFLVFQRENANAAFLRAFMLLLLPTMAGYFAAHPVRRLINEANFKRLVFFLLAVIGLSSTWQFLLQLLH